MTFARVTNNLIPEPFLRELEKRLIDLAASDNIDRAAWLRHGSPFFMSGLAVLIASARGFDRGRYLELAEALHHGMTEPEIFEHWLKLTPVRAARFLPRVRQRKECLRYNTDTLVASQS